MNLAFLAAYERGEESGASFHATAMAERLEGRGAGVHWFHVPPRQRSTPQKIRGIASLKPAWVAYHAARPLPDLGSPQAVIAMNSYMAPYLDSVHKDIPRILDFHNLEWRILQDLARGNFPRGVYLRWQTLLMRRFERAAMSRASLSLFVTEEELELANDAVPSALKLLVPNVMPRLAVERAKAIREARRLRHHPSRPLLAYVGGLTWEPNRAALEGFLKNIWPRLRERSPDLQLTVAGTMSEADRRMFSAVPGVEARGFVRDLTSILRDASAVVFPFSAAGGSSLRVLFYAWADIPVVGSSAAFRGFPADVGLRADSIGDWVDLVMEALVGGTEFDRSRAAAREAAIAQQTATEPWDALHEALRGLTGE